MAQILRAYQSEIPKLVRSYGTQRRVRSYYDILRVRPSASSKEIKDAFIKLSKQAHPDISGKNSHDEFVKINEAYTTLSKESSRRRYDMSQGNPTYREDFVRRPSAGSRRAADYASAQDIYHTYYANRNRWHTERNPHSNAWEDFRWSAHRREPEPEIKYSKRDAMMSLITFSLFFIIIATLTIDSHAQHYSSTLERSERIAREYETIKKQAEGKTLEEQMERILELHEQNKPKEK